MAPAATAAPATRRRAMKDSSRPECRARPTPSPSEQRLLPRYLWQTGQVCSIKWQEVGCGQRHAGAYAAQPRPPACPRSRDPAAEVVAGARVRADLLLAVL